MARLRLSRYGLGHAVQAQCRAPSPHPEDPLSDPELAGLRGWSEAARRPDTLAGRVRHRRLASAAADYARRSGPVFGRRDRIGVDAPACLPPCPASGRRLRREHISAARAGITRSRPHNIEPPQPWLRWAPPEGDPARPSAAGD